MRESKNKRRTPIKENELRDMRLEELESKLNSFDTMKNELNDYTEKLRKLYEKGLINEEGDLLHNAGNDREQEEENKSQNSDM